MKRSRHIAVLVGVWLATWSHASSAQIKIGYIDSGVLRERMSEFGQIERELEKLRLQYEGEAQEQYSRLQRLADDYRRQELLMSETRRVEMKAQIEESDRELQRFTQERLGPSGELFRRNIELTAPLYEKVNAALKRLAEAEGYDFIFDVAGNGTIVYADPSRHDLTEQLLEILQEARGEEDQ